jgi:hypothetical protein
MNKDVDLLAEAYQKVLEGTEHCKWAHNKKNPCDCDGCEECKDNQTVDEAKNAKPDYIDVDKDGDKKESMKKAVADKKKKPIHKENAEMAQAYETILEFKHINKKFARRYNKVTAAMLKAQPGSEEYGALKTEREDLVTILKDHGQTPKDLEAFLIKKEKENPLPDVQEPQTMNQYKDSSYSDTADISSENDYEADMHSPQSEVAQMPPDAPTPQEVKAVNVQASTSHYVANNS